MTGRSTGRPPRVTARLVGHNALSGAALLFVRLAITFVVSPVVVHALGNLRYGAWELALGVIGYMGLLDLGLSPAIVRHVALAMGRDDTRQVARVFWTGLVVYAGLGLLAGAGTLALALRPSLLFGNLVSGVPEARLLLALLALDLVVRFPGTAIVALWNGIQRHVVVNSADALLFVLQGALTLWIVPRTSSSPLLALAWIVVGITVMRYVLLAALLAFLHGGLVGRASLGEPTALLPLLAFGGKSLLLRGATVLNRELVPIVIAHAVGLSSVVFFAIPGRLFDYARQLAYAIGGPLTAWFAHALGRGDREQLLRNWLRSARPLQGFLLGSAVTLAFLGEPFLARWMGTEISGRGAVVVRWFSLGLAFEALGVNAVRLLTASARHGRAALVQGGTGLVAVVLSWVFGSRHGLVGIVVPLVLLQVVRQGILLAMAGRELGLHPWRYAGRTALVFALPVALAAIALRGLALAVPPSGYPALALHGAVAVIAFLLGCLPVRELRASLLDIFRTVA